MKPTRKLKPNPVRYELIITQTDDNWDEFDIVKRGSVRENMIILFQTYRDIRGPNVTRMVLQDTEGNVIMGEEF